MTKPYYTSQDGEDLLGFLEKSLTKEQAIAMYKMNMMKYAYRFDKKNGVEDLDKIIDYATRCKQYLNTEKKVVITNGQDNL